jgi:hypothetical protein
LTDWRPYLVVALTALVVWRTEARLLRAAVVALHLALLGQAGIFLANAGRNTFEAVENKGVADTFREGVFAEAKAADSFARKQIVIVYITALCLGVLAIWPAVGKRRRAHSR